MIPDDRPVDVRARLEAALRQHPALAERIERALLVALHTKGHTSIDEIHRAARARVHDATGPTGAAGGGTATGADGAAGVAPDPNACVEPAWDALERAAVHDITLDRAAQVLTPDEVDDIVSLTLRREEARSLEEIANLQSVSFGLLAEKVHQFCRIPRGHSTLPESEAMAVRVALTRHFISDQLEFIGIARRHLTVRDFDALVGRIVGDDAGQGRIGGKAGGLFLAERILARAARLDPRAPAVPIVAPVSYVLRSDTLERFLDHLGMNELQAHKYKDLEAVRNEYPLILKLFRNGEFPRVIVERLRALLLTLGETPLIVRSSSLLEDRFGAAFTGKYRSVFVANQGPPEERLAQLLGAIAEVYASTLHPDPISYRRRHNLLDYAENMAVLIQRVVGTRYRRWFLPVWAGVAFSRNEFRRNPRIRPEDGIARLVFGLGTRAVDRVSRDFPRMVPLGAPTLRPEVETRDVCRFSQFDVDAINLERNAFETLPIRDLLGEEPFPALDQVMSVLTDGHLRRPVSRLLTSDPDELVVTFDKFVHESPFPGVLRWALRTLEEAYGQPVDIEFAYDGERLHLLQCRPQVTRRRGAPVVLPAGLDPARQVFSSRRDVTTGAASGLEVVVVVDPADYDPLPTNERRLQVARAVRLLNQRLAGRPFALLGPGRWGTRDPRMGIPAGYADINNTRLLVEIARAKDGVVPEASFGSHFFQDLVESDILYLALYPDEPGSYNEEFLLRSPNVLAEIVPECADLGDVVRVIDVPRVTGGLHLHVAMDGDQQRAVGYVA